MSNKTKNKPMILWFPILIAMYPILHLYDVNVDQVSFTDVWPELAKAVGGVSAIWLFFWLIHREPRRAGIVASILVSLFYFYFIYSGWIAQMMLVVLVTNWLIFFLYKSKSDFRGFVSALNVGSLVIVGAATWGIVSQIMNPPPMERGNVAVELTEEQTELVGKTPNVYFILLDGYGGQDALEEFYRTDNSEFLGFLEEQGFWIGRHSRSNYLRTLFSVPSTLNMEYFTEFIEQNDLYELKDERPALDKMKNSKVRLTLEEFGYKTVGISSGFTGWDMFGVDHFIDYKRGGANEFHSIVNQHTPVFPIAVELAVMDPFEKHRELQIRVIETIPEFPNLFPDQPLAGFIHIMCPHPPFVFMRDGSPAEQPSPLFNLGDGDYLVGQTMDPVQYQSAYSHQLYYLNTLMTDAITKLRENDPDAIIVVQGDHGPGSGYHGTNIMKNNFLERASILNAIHLPNQDYEEFYPTMSPVNTFRLIFNNYFGGDYELLPDETFFSVVGRPYDFFKIEFETDGTEEEGDESEESAPTLNE